MNHIDNLAKMRAMQSAYQSRNSRLLDMLLNDPEHRAQMEGKLKRVQFDTSFELSEELDRVADLLDVSRREFLEAALVDALHRAKASFFSTYKDITGVEFGEDPAGPGSLVIEAVKE